MESSIFSAIDDSSDRRIAEIALLGSWHGCNYGSVFTTFSLYRTLESLGRSVSLLEFSTDLDLLSALPEE